MALDPLATVADLNARLGRDLTEAEETRAEALLRDASAAVRRYTGQQITAVEGDSVRLKVSRGRITLPQRPVTAVIAIQDVNSNDIEFTWDAGDQIPVPSNVPDSWSFVPFRDGITHVDVIYDHGYDPVPDDIIAVVCQMVLRAFGQAPDQSGMQSESIAGYSYTVGAAAAAGAVGMLPDEKAVLDNYRRRGGVATLA